MKKGKLKNRTNLIGDTSFTQGHVSSVAHKFEQLTEGNTKEKRGITLIALIITIIVCLILAAVSVVTLTGENGIKKQAENAKEETRGASVEEERDLWKANQEADNYTENRTAQTLSELLDDLENQKLITEEERKTIDATGKVTIGSRTIIFREKTLVEEIASSNYGDYINYNVDLNDDGDITNDWRIFYDDGKNIFIIAADYLRNTKLPSTADIKAYSGQTYSAYWPSKSNLTKVGSSSISETVANKYMLSWRNAYSESINDNIKAVADLLDTETWSDFAVGVSGAEAIGTPTLEMFMASWNAKGYPTLYCNNSTSKGYYVGKSDKPEGTSVTIAITGNRDDSLYFPHTDYFEDCYGYWLASPSAYTSTDLAAIICFHEIDKNSYNNNYYYSVRGASVRPVVCLPSGIKGSQDADGIWTVQE